MIDFKCSCGAHFGLADEIVERARCPRCGARAAEVLGLLKPEPPPVPTPPPAPVAPPPPAVPTFKLTGVRPAPPTPPKPPAQPAPAPPTTSHAGGLRLRTTEDTFKPKPFSLPILEGGAATTTDDGVPILMPIEDQATPAAPAPPPVPAAKEPVATKSLKVIPPPPKKVGATPPPPPAVKPPGPLLKPAASKALVSSVREIQPTGEHGHVSVSKEHAVPARGAHGTGIPCAAHPDKEATHNCMNCAKPICIECVHQFGYYCSAQCKSVVASREPKLSRDSSAKEVDSAVGKTMDLMGRFLVKLKIPAVILIVGVIGYFVYLKLAGPRGRMTANFDLFSEISAFHAEIVAPDTIVAQGNDELVCVNLPAQKELWRVNLAPLEEKYEKPKPKQGAKVVPDSREFSENLGSVSSGGEQSYRDRLRFREAMGGYLVLASTRQLVVMDAKDGSVKWKQFKPNGSISIGAVHEGGILCTLTEYPDYSSEEKIDWRNRPKPKSEIVSYALVDGSPKWTSTNTLAYGGLQHNGQLVTLTFEGGAGAASAATSGGTTTRSTTGKKTLGGIQGLTGGGGDDDDSDEEEDVPAGPAGNYSLRFLSLADGSLTGQKTMALSAGGRLQKLGDRFCVVAGPEVWVYDKGQDPALKVKFPGNVRSVAMGGDTIAATTDKGVVALDAATGQQKFVRDGLQVKRVHVGPDGSVYVSAEVPKGDATKGEAEKYRLATVAVGGFSFPSETVAAFLKLKPKTGETAWGVKYIGEQVYFAETEILVVDTFEKLHLFAGGEPFAGHLSLRSLNPRNGKDRWTYLAKADLYHKEVVGKKFFVVISEDPPAGRFNPSCNFKMQYVECK